MKQIMWRHAHNATKQTLWSCIMICFDGIICWEWIWSGGMMKFNGHEAMQWSYNEFQRAWWSNHNTLWINTKWSNNMSWWTCKGMAVWDYGDISKQQSKVMVMSKAETWRYTPWVSTQDSHEGITVRGWSIREWSNEFENVAIQHFNQNNSVSLCIQPNSYYAPLPFLDTNLCKTTLSPPS